MLLRRGAGHDRGPAPSTPGRELAEDLNAESTAPEHIAMAYAEPYQANLRQANYDGCLDGLEGRPKSPP
jgi:hypothetical protein